jgi:hypothetical protein
MTNIKSKYQKVPPSKIKGISKKYFAKKVGSLVSKVSFKGKKKIKRMKTK